ncbi:MAG: phosphoglucosamine mutase [Bacteroidales bacterium]|nr:phosphoglucosamine mutase [Bacteroidales bacterium]HOY38172.1 phosphoglucosamine mutase [Bacteroidales bacterium]HQP05234.1 phosphoglucosamine mutase [Bacteroidales bacterium]
MTLIKSISGIRGTIGGVQGEGLTPVDICKFTAAYAQWMQHSNSAKVGLTIVVGRDARISGPVVHNFVCNTLISMGISVIDLGLATTPTTEMAVILEKADGGIIITASHNPRQWNALKMLNSKGEFLTAEEGILILELANKSDFSFAAIDSLGKITEILNYENKHIDEILKLTLVQPEVIRKARFKVVIDCVNSVGGIVIPKLLKALGVIDVVELYCNPNGEFPHNPEPLPEHLNAISQKMTETGADVGFVVDPDVDRLAIVCEDGSMFGEEYTLVSVADYVLQYTPGTTVSNMSSTQALRDVSAAYGCSCFSSAVGEVNVVAMMKQHQAVIGGEGNGGVIYPELHYGRDALVGIALFLTNLAKRGTKVSQLRNGYPAYVISKNKIELNLGVDVDKVLENVKKHYSNHNISTIDGVKVDFGSEWVHLRKSNTEPIIRIYAESQTREQADNLALSVIEKIKSYM